jgi:hypothetical protein
MRGVLHFVTKCDRWGEGVDKNVTSHLSVDTIGHIYTYIEENYIIDLREHP